MKMLHFNRLMLVSFVLLLVWALSSLLLLDRVTVDSPKAVASPKKIKVLIRTGTESSAMRQISQTFEADTGIQVEFIELGRDVYFTSVGTQLLAGTDIVRYCLHSQYIDCSIRLSSCHSSTGFLHE